MSGNSSRNKGAKAERELWHILRDFYGLDVRRGQCFNGEADLVGLPGIHPEVKRTEKTSVWAWIQQAFDEMRKKKDGDNISIFFRRNRSPWFVIVPLELWVDMYLAWRDEDDQV